MKIIKRTLILILCSFVLVAIGITAFAASPLTVNPTRSTVFVNGIEATFEAYNIGGNNFFKLRDLAFAVNGTKKQFEIGYDNATKAISLTSGQPYTSVGGEMTQGDGNAKTAYPTASRIYFDSKELNLTVYNIGGNNFFKLRDLMEVLDVYVGYDNATKNITLDTSKGYEQEGSTATPQTEAEAKYEAAFITARLGRQLMEDFPDIPRPEDMNPSITFLQSHTTDWTDLFDPPEIVYFYSYDYNFRPTTREKAEQLVNEYYSYLLNQGWSLNSTVNLGAYIGYNLIHPTIEYEVGVTTSSSSYGYDFFITVTTYPQGRTPVKEQIPVPTKAPITVILPSWEMDSVGGVTFKMGIRNNSDKTIKYINFSRTCYNAVGDEIQCSIRRSSIVESRYTGPLEPGAYSGSVASTVKFYNYSFSYSLWNYIIVEYMDGTKIEINSSNWDSYVAVGLFQTE